MSTSKWVRLAAVVTAVEASGSYVLECRRAVFLGRNYGVILVRRRDNDQGLRAMSEDRRNREAHRAAHHTRSRVDIYREQAAEAARIVASWPESMRKAIWPPRKESE